MKSIEVNGNVVITQSVIDVMSVLSSLSDSNPVLVMDADTGSLMRISRVVDVDESDIDDQICAVIYVEKL